MKIAMAQINSTVGDIEGNREKILNFMDISRKKNVDLIIFPELALIGYPPQDILYKKSFIRQNKLVLKEIIEKNNKIIGVIGFVDYDNKNLYNAAAIFKGNKLYGTVYKTLLPTYDVFDEDRYFKPNKENLIKPVVIECEEKKLKLGVEICEDLWDQDYDIKVTDILGKKGANLLINISASPFYVGKRIERMKLLKEKALANRLPIFYVNLVGGQDELVFDGQSLAVDAAGDLIGFGRPFEEDLIIIDIDLDSGIGTKVKIPNISKTEEMFNALVLGIRDYFKKTGFEKAVVGMSGGIDSSLTTCLAVEALGKENVIGVSMPSKFSSDHSKTDAFILAENLGICFVTITIQNIMEAYAKTLDKPLEKIRQYFKIDRKMDNPVADENIQPRIRGNSLMDISNRFAELKILVLNTGNKTELALGYCTLYGDMSGGLGAIGDVSKIEVYKLAEYVNRKYNREIIPINIFKKKPSAELKEDQYDPFDYDIVSLIVDEVIERRKSKKELTEMGYPKDIVEDTLKRIRNSEYKRWQAPPCIKITPKAFGIGWKMPIVNKFKD